MIIRILGEGQYDVADGDLDHLNSLDAALQVAVDGGDTAGFATALAALLAAVRDRGTTVADEVLTASDLVLPAPDADLPEVVALLGDEGLIPGWGRLSCGPDSAPTGS
jgi:hypothetical protein